MNGFKKCENGHFFKEDLNACPYCPSSKGASNNASASNDLNKTMVDVVGLATAGMPYQFWG